MALFAPTKQQVLDALGDIKYEWDQLGECRRIENSFRVPAYPSKVYLPTLTDKRLYNLALTGFALHARNLLLFFHAPRREEDIVAADYFDPPATWTPPKVSGKDETWRRDILDRVNKQAAHLTYSRLNKKKWEVDEIYDYLSIIWQHFVSTASPQKFKRN